MGKIYTVAIIGCGNRGDEVYNGNICDNFSDKFKTVAVCDPLEFKAKRAAAKANISEENIFYNEEEFFKKKRADLLIVATQDNDHTRMALKGLELGYDILCEKPITGKIDECYMLLEAQKKYNKKVFVAHVLRYAPAFVKIKELLDSGVIGKLISINSIEQVWFGHFAHSFVRGNWRRKDETSPIILAKTCHDLDLLQYYANSKCKTVNSIGDLSYFNIENAPEGSTDRCLDCPHIDDCVYSAKKIYIDRWKKNPNYAFTLTACQERPVTEDGVKRALRNGPYGRCVFRCDNDVCDNQLTNMVFENGVTASLSLMAFTATGGRVMRFHGSNGEIHLDEGRDEIRIGKHGIGWEDIKISELNKLSTLNHGGGDYMLLQTLYDMLEGTAIGQTTLENSIESHLMAYAAEKSRLAGGSAELVH